MIINLLFIVVVGELARPFIMGKIQINDQSASYIIVKWIILFLGLYLALVVSSSSKASFIYVAF